MKNTEMTLAVFVDLAFAHGGDLSEWPKATQAEAAALVEASSEARALLTTAAEFRTALANARPEDPVPSVDLMSRILADAATVKPVAAFAPAPQPQPRRTLFFSRIWDVFSPAAACAASVVFGLWLGYAGPVDLTDVAGETFGFGANEEFALLDDLGASPFVGVIDLLEASE